MSVSVDAASAVQNPQSTRQASVTRQASPSEEQGAGEAAETKVQETSEPKSSGGNPPHVGNNLNVVG
ncbi:MAG: hypothetical protein H7833_10215 [Magnetococcus sp. DMHC-1]|nr:hypothetical protein [Magnetococcales bacterium]